MKHVDYVNKLVDLQDKEGKRLSAATLRAFKKLLRASGGNLRKLMGLVHVTRKTMIRQMAREARSAAIKAKKLGKKFGQDKLTAAEELQ